MLKNGHVLKIYKNIYSKEYYKSIVKNDKIYSDDCDIIFENIYDWYNYIFDTNITSKEIEDKIYYTTNNINLKISLLMFSKNR